MKRRTATFAAAATCVMAAGVAHGQSRQIPAPPQTQPVVIRDATIHPVTSDVIEHGHVVFSNGVISAVGAGPAPILPGAIVVEAEGLHVYPGLIAAETSIGLVETGAVDVTKDHTELGNFTPEVRSAVAINPDSDHIPVARANGILTALTLPRGRLVAGRCAVIRLDGWTWEDMAIDADAGLVVNWPRTEPVTAWWMDTSEEEQRAEIAEDLRDVERWFDEATAYVKAKDNDDELRTDLRFEAMRPVLQGEAPVYVQASSASQIESAVAWSNRRGLNIIIVGGQSADQVVDLLREFDIPVIIGGTHRLPSRRDQAYDQPFALPATLHEAGVRFCIAGPGRGPGSGNERNLNHQAATAAAYGLPRLKALEAVTIVPARIIGIGDTHGSLEIGKSATLILTTGDPLEITTDTLLAYIDGRRIDLGNRQKSLYAKYREKYEQLGLID